MGTSLSIDRSDLADTAQSDKLAELIVTQLLPQMPKLLPLPIDDVAKACGIVEIQPLETDAFEGGLVQDEHKVHGFILVKAGQRPDRARFTVAHELGHFVNLRHVAPPGTERLLCSKADFLLAGKSVNPRFGMEAQANEFAACLLMPRSQLVPLPFMRGSPEIARILALQNLCQVSKEAAARRYIELHGDHLALVFTKDGSVAYSTKSRDFPWLDIRPGQPIYSKTLSRTFTGPEGEVSDQEEADSHHWLEERTAPRWQLWEEVLVQSNGYRMTLLVGESSDDD